ncbi:MAG: VP1/VP3 family protein [Candidatus Peribacteria bacterium]|nr:VP1/VP3 family protein [Candidatus Peribacteria bacterium]
MLIFLIMIIVLVPAVYSYKIYKKQ